MIGIDMTRRGFLGSVLGAYVSAATGGLSAGAEAAIKTAAPLLPIPSADDVTSAYNWLADHMFECEHNGGGYFPSQILKCMKTISHHLDHAGTENPFREQIKIAERLCEIDPEKWVSGMARPNYMWGSKTEESRIAQLLSQSVTNVSDVLNMPSPSLKFQLDKQAHYERQMAARNVAEIERNATVEATEEETVQTVQTAERRVATSLTASEEQSSYSLVQNAFTNTVNAINVESKKRIEQTILISEAPEEITEEPEILRMLSIPSPSGPRL